MVGAEGCTEGKCPWEHDEEAEAWMETAQSSQQSKESTSKEERTSKIVRNDPSGVRKIDADRFSEVCKWRSQLRFGFLDGGGKYFWVNAAERSLGDGVAI